MITFPYRCMIWLVICGLLSIGVVDGGSPSSVGYYDDSEQRVVHVEEAELEEREYYFGPTEGQEYYADCEADDFYESNYEIGPDDGRYYDYDETDWEDEEEYYSGVGNYGGDYYVEGMEDEEFGYDDYACDGGYQEVGYDHEDYWEDEASWEEYVFPSTGMEAPSNSMMVEEERVVVDDLALETKNLLDKAYKKIDSGVFDINDILPGARQDLDQFVAVSDGAELFGVEDAVYISLRNNADIETAYLGRETEVRSLRKAENAYTPTGSLSLGSTYSRTHSRSDFHSESVTLPAPTLALRQQLKTGGSLSMNWTNSYSFTKKSSESNVANSTSSITLGFAQPLLKGAGFDIGKLPLTRAYLTEEGNLLTLKSTVITNITDVTKRYRAYLQATKQFEIDKKALERSREQFERDKVMVMAGRKPKNDLLNSGRNAANKEFSFETQVNNLDESRLSLLRLLNVDLELEVMPLDVRDFDLDLDSMPTLDEAMEIALLNNPSYLRQLLSYRGAELTLMEAKNNTLWALDFEGSLRSAGSNDNSLGRSMQKAFDFRNRVFSAGLTLSIPVNDTDREDTLVSARIGLRNAKISLRTAEESLKQSVKNALRGIKQNAVKLRIARIETALAQRQLEAKKVELESGRTTNFEYTDTQDFLIQAENQELATRISLLDGLADFDALLGTTLDTWNVTLKDRMLGRPRFEDTLFNQPAPMRVSEVAKN